MKAIIDDTAGRGYEVRVVALTAERPYPRPAEVDEYIEGCGWVRGEIRHGNSSVQCRLLQLWDTWKSASGTDDKLSAETKSVPVQKSNCEMKSPTWDTGLPGPGEF
jgi:hypothetical protein